MLAVGRNILEIAYHLLSEQTTYRELGIDYFDRYRAERLKRRRLAQLQRLGYPSPSRPFPPLPKQDFQDRHRRRFRSDQRVRAPPSEAAPLAPIPIYHASACGSRSRQCLYM